MIAGVLTDAAALALAHEPVDASQVVAGSPTTGIHEIDETTGVWEIEVYPMHSGIAIAARVTPATTSLDSQLGLYP